MGDILYVLQALMQDSPRRLLKVSSGRLSGSICPAKKLASEIHGARIGLHGLLDGIFR
jgi:hypothetical protein